jgi:hypothetical protein
MPEQIPNSKANIIELLRLLGSDELQLDYEKNVPHVDITTELVCMWFDDQYHPNSSHFTSCFKKNELAALAEFHQFYDERHKQLPESQGTVRAWLANPVWREIMLKAQKTLERITA